MIFESFQVLLFGMLGIFLVMAIIYGVIVLLSRISARAAQRAGALALAPDDAVVLEEVEEVEVIPVENAEPLETPAAAGEYYLEEYYPDQYVTDGYYVEEYYEQPLADGAYEMEYVEEVQQ